MPRLPGIFVEVKGDISQLKQDMTRARGIVRESATGMSDSLNNALSTQAISRGTNALIRNLGQVQRASKVTGRAFDHVGVDLGDLRKHTGLTERSFAKLQSRMLKNRAAKQTERSLKAIARQANLTGLQMVKLRARMGDTQGAMRQLGRMGSGSIGKLTGAVFSLRSAFLGLGVGYAVKSLFDAGKQADQLERSFKAITGSTVAANAEFKFLHQVADDLGQNFWTLAEAYKGILAATKDTALEGEAARKVFTGLIEASTALGLSADDTGGILKAFTQMVSKGTVAAEELRGQLGERLYGAFQLAAKAMGTNTEGLNDMLKKGQVLAKDLLPKLTANLSRLYGAEARASVNSATAASEKFKEAWTGLLVDLGKYGLIDSMTEAMAGFAVQMREPEMQAAVKSLGTSLGTLASAAPGAIKGLTGVAAALGRLVDKWESIPPEVVGVLTGAALGAKAGPYGILGGAAIGAGAGFAQRGINSDRAAAAAARARAAQLQQVLDADRQIMLQGHATVTSPLIDLWEQAGLPRPTVKSKPAAGSGSGKALPTGMTQEDYAEEGRQIQKLHDFQDMIARLGMNDKQRELFDLKKKYEKYYADLDDLVANDMSDNWDVVNSHEERKAQLHQGYLAEKEEMEKGSLQRTLEQWADTNGMIEDGTINTLQTIQAGWANIIGGVMSGEIKTLGDLATSVTDMILQSFVNLFAQIIAQYGMSGVASLFLGIGFGGGGGGGGAGGFAGSVGTSVTGGLVGKWLMSTAVGEALFGGTTAAVVPAALTVAGTGATVGAMGVGGGAYGLGLANLGIDAGLAGGGGTALGTTALGTTGLAAMAPVLAPIVAVIIGGQIMDALTSDTRFDESEAKSYFEKMPTILAGYTAELEAVGSEHDTLIATMDKSGWESFIQNTKIAGHVLGYTREEVEAFIKTQHPMAAEMLATYNATEDMNGTLQLLGVNVGNIITQFAGTTEQLSLLNQQFLSGDMSAERFAAAADDVANSVVGLTDTLNGASFNEFMDELDAVGDSMGYVNNQATSVGTNVEQWNDNGGSTNSGSSQTGVYFHQGGLIMHDGGMVATAQANKLVTAHGGAWFGQHLKSDEVPVVAQSGEFMLSRGDVGRLGGPAAINRLRKRGAGGGGTTVIIDSPTIIINTETLDEETIDRMMPYILEQMAQSARSDYGA